MLSKQIAKLVQKNLNNQLQLYKIVTILFLIYKV
jgi:hypothetical protein